MSEFSPESRDTPSDAETGGGYEQGSSSDSSQSTPTDTSQRAGELATKGAMDDSSDAS